MTGHDSTHGQGVPMRHWWTVFVLFAAFTLSYVDRTVLSLVIQPLKHDLHLSDVAISLLSGLAFAVFYALIALPTARLSDRGSRHIIVASGIAFWSVATALCGVARTFFQLFAARMLVGAGEATLQPAAFSLIAELFPKERRGTAYALFGGAVPIGSGLALIGGGAIVHWMEGHTLSLPFLGTVHPWQAVFLIVGLPGLVLALLALTIAEPRHGARAASETPVPPAAYFGFVRTNFSLLIGFFTCFSFAGMLSVAFSTWGPTFFVRTYGLSLHTVGFAIGAMTLGIGPIAAVIAAVLIGQWQKRGSHDAPLRAAVLAMILTALSYALTPLMPTWQAALAMWGCGMAFGSTNYAAAATALPLFVPLALRAQISALYLLVVTIIAIAAGPTIVAVITDYVLGNEARLGLSLTLTAAAFGVAETTILLFVMPAFRKSALRLESASQST